MIYGGFRLYPLKAVFPSTTCIFGPFLQGQGARNNDRIFFLFKGAQPPASQSFPLSSLKVVRSWWNNLHFQKKLFGSRLGLFPFTLKQLTHFVPSCRVRTLKNSLHRLRQNSEIANHEENFRPNNNLTGGSSAKNSYSIFLNCAFNSKTF